VTAVAVDIYDVQSVANGGDHHRSDHCAENRSGAAEQAYTPTTAAAIEKKSSLPYRGWEADHQTRSIDKAGHAREQP